MKKLFLHIGPHKTGSSYIQKTLVDNRQRVFDAGLDYPDAGMTFLWGHHALAAAVDRGHWDEARAYVDRIGQCDQDVLLSSEDFDKLSGDAVARLAASLDRVADGLQVDVVFVRRAAAELLVSSWQENVKNGDMRSWERFFFDHLSRPQASDIINPINILQRYEACFGADALTVVDYDAARAGGDDLFDVFAAALGRSALRGLGDCERVNERMPLAQVEIVRLLNVRAQASGRSVDCRISGALWRYLAAEPDATAHGELLRHIDIRSEPLLLSDFPVFTEFAQRFEARYGHRVVNPMTGRGDTDGRCEVSLPRPDVIANESSMRALRLIEAGVYRHYVA